MPGREPEAHPSPAATELGLTHGAVSRRPKTRVSASGITAPEDLARFVLLHDADPAAS